MQETIYYQCRLSRGSERMVSWIEERGAVKDAKIELLAHGAELWNVDEVYGGPLTASQLNEKQRKDRGSLPSLVGA